MSFEESSILRKKAHALIPGGCHTYAKGDDQFPDRPRPSSSGAGLPCVGHGRKEYIEYGMGLRAVTLGHAFPPSSRRSSGQLDRQQLHAPITNRGRMRRAVPGIGAGNGDGQILQGRLGLAVRRRSAVPGLHGARHDRNLCRPPLFLDQRLVHRND